LKLKLEVNGIFDKRLIQRKNTIKLNENAGMDALFQQVFKTTGLSRELLEKCNSIILLNGSRLDEKDIGQLNENDTISILSPLGGG
jgi:hypothetical protein